MHTSACNKCKVGLASEGDTWCTGCSSLELAQGLLKQKWHSKGVRQIVEETLLSSARLCRAFSNLDRTLGSDAGGPPPGISAKSQPARPRSRSPARGERPPLPRHSRPSSHSPVGRSPSEESDLSWEPHASAVKKEQHTDLREERGSRGADRSERGGDREHHSGRGSERPPEPEYPPRHSSPAPKRKKKKTKKATRRGGTRHQRHYREADNPLKRSHRKLSGDTLSLARNFREGLERRA